jgi:hypothetical protein
MRLFCEKAQFTNTPSSPQGRSERDRSLTATVRNYHFVFEMAYHNSRPALVSRFPGTARRRELRAITISAHRTVTRISCGSSADSPSFHTSSIFEKIICNATF